MAAVPQVRSFSLQTASLMMTTTIKLTLGEPSAKRLAPNPFRQRELTMSYSPCPATPRPRLWNTTLRQPVAGRNQTVVNIRIEDHQEFIAETYKGAEEFGND